ncbi:MAG: adenylate/guanylate cyclase domain-containing protein [Actinobacteria bacterium]|nr:MAG: adenylate/guanylate cyclase domain-containing protein [Actinomycetota bacterium]TML46390.1 MAG: adenylate/guanylate cyclase domain-containing protein [Actinomycetota bacterium]
MTEKDAPPDSNEQAWRAILTGQVRGLKAIRRLVGWIPAGPRCKLCLAPLRPPGSVVLRPVGYGPSRLNRRLCKACFRSVGKHPGGAEVEISMLFADVRGSTSLAEHMSAQDFSNVIARFYGTAAKVVDEWNGLVDKFVGDEVVALFIPGFAGEDHAARAVNAARDLMRATGNDGDDPWVAVGAGVHTGIPYVGRVGEGDACDFTAVGDAVNTTARLAMNAGAGEILVSASTAKASGLDTSALEMRTLSLRGREEVTEVWVAAA